MGKHEQFPELYALRWGIETAYFHLKHQLSVEKFSGKTPNSIRQDFWASMVLLNCVAIYQAEADEAVAKRQTAKPIKHKNRARTSDLVITLRDRFIFASLCEQPDVFHKEVDDIINTLARTVSPARPGRSYPRRYVPHQVNNYNLKSQL